jgi:hypothetical protein
VADPSKTKAHGSPAWTRRADISDYDGALDKEDCSTEAVPYAWGWYQDLTAMLGDGFTTERTGLVHARKLALARHEAGKTRTVERAICNSLPATADDCLGQWVKCLNVKAHADDSRHEIRQKAAARFAAIQGATIESVDESTSALLGDVFVENIRQLDNDLSDPPDGTYWPGVNPGPGAYSLGGGAWLSPRCHLIVKVTRPASGALGKFLSLVQVDLFDHLNRLMPAWATFTWTTGTSFSLDISLLDFDGISDP